MKTGMDILRRAMNLLGYTNASGEIDAGLSAELYRRGLETVNQVYAEVWPLEKSEKFQPLTSIGQEIPLSTDAVETVMPKPTGMGPTSSFTRPCISKNAIMCIARQSAGAMCCR